MKKPAILIVEDDADILLLIRATLEREGYSVRTAGSAAAIAPEIRHCEPDAILLDLVLPDGDGLKLIADIRKQTKASIIVVSGKNDMVDKVVGLEMGADDYIGKPFQIKELCARVKAQLRRTQILGQNGTGGTAGQREAKLSFDKWVLDPDKLQIFDETGASGKLTVKEFRLLHALALSAGRVLTREQILDLARSDDFSVTDRAIDTQITRIRKKIGDDAANPRIIQAVRGAGYSFVAAVHSSS